MSRSLGAVWKIATDYMFMGEDGTPHGHAERALATNVLSTGHQKSDSSQRPKTKHHRRQKQSKHAHSNRNRLRSESSRRHSNGSVERATQTIHAQIRTITDFTERQIAATMGFDKNNTTQHNATQHNASSVMKWLVRLAGWTLTAFHVRGDGMTARQRIRAKSFKQQLAAFGAQILFKPQKTSGQQLAVK